MVHGEGVTDLIVNQRRPGAARGHLQRTTAPLPVTPRQRVPVVIHSTDPITRAGALSHLRQQPVIELVEEDSERPGAVALLLAEQWDETLLPRLRRVLRNGETSAVLVVESLREPQLLQVIECGVVSILWRREATPARLSQAVIAASRGEADLPADLLKHLMTQVGRLQRHSSSRSGSAPVGLTPREIDILRLIADGLDTREIASQLAYSERTVKNVLHQLTTRMQLRNRAHAVAHALREGYI